MAPKRPRDFSQAAKLVIEIATGEKPNRDPTPEEQGKDPAAVALGRKGGRKGGKSRAERMPAMQPVAAPAPPRGHHFDARITRRTPATASAARPAPRRPRALAA